ncbi:hypothetical protein HS1genome_1428 [Sulfodiicoccus acidiphilus]|uniref:Thioredoxin domain-containing protein n=1 Tax=Sulfodiicoccus acidiphilus TaxID=1670455 RepID=A0A348B4D7_9CREN|nr:DUF929 family protein [Sulfodiicoccus acidiphilus]BBD73039.1 hypothetical protein HS1genome_1428 [Sulfodiicoccus acidiphilus]GGU05656.1 hypothetical protein GCM10007116_22530 [Sulfodiicoccus acidiphilus]
MSKKGNLAVFSLVVVVVVASLAYVELQSSSLSSGPIYTKVAPSVELQLRTLASTGYSIYDRSYDSFANFIGNGSELTYDGRPVVIFVGAEWCPYCGAEMWPLILALSRFGNISGLEYMLSSSTDVYPNVPTFTLVNVSYTSPYISLLEYEYQDRNHNPLQAVPSNVYALWEKYTSGGIPFIDVANVYIDAGSTVNPALLSGKNWTYVLNTLSNDPNSTLSREIYYTANLLTAEICRVDGNSPSSVCYQSGVQTMEAYLSHFQATNVTTYVSSTQLISNAVSIPNSAQFAIYRYLTTLHDVELASNPLAMREPTSILGQFHPTPTSIRRPISSLRFQTARGVRYSTIPTETPLLRNKRLQPPVLLSYLNIFLELTQ